MRKQQKNTENRKRKQNTKKKVYHDGNYSSRRWILLLFTLPPHQIDVLRSYLFYYMNSPSLHEVGRPKLSDLRKYKSLRGSNDARQQNEPTILCSLYCVLNSLVYCALLLLRSSFCFDTHYICGTGTCFYTLAFLRSDTTGAGILIVLSGPYIRFQSLLGKNRSFACLSQPASKIIQD